MPFLYDILANILSHLSRQLVGTLQASWHLDGSQPVGVVVALFMGELSNFFVLDGLLLALLSMVGDGVLGGCCCPFSDILSNHVEVVCAI